MNCPHVEQRHLGDSSRFHSQFVRSVFQINELETVPIAELFSCGLRPARVHSEEWKELSSGVILVGVNDVTQILSRIEQGDPRAAEQLLPLMYEELRKLAAARLAQEQPGQTLQATALVHEAYMRLVHREDEQRWDSRGHFFAAAAEAMRRILINRARDKKRLKRGGDLCRIDLEQIDLALDTPDEQLLALDEALEEFTTEDPKAAELVKLRFFAGLNLREAAAELGMPRRTADRQWAYARAWLYDWLEGDESNSN